MNREDTMRESAIAALKKFALSWDIADLPESEPMLRLWERDADFRSWYEHAPEMQVIHRALDDMVAYAALRRDGMA